MLCQLGLKFNYVAQSDTCSWLQRPGSRTGAYRSGTYGDGYRQRAHDSLKPLDNTVQLRFEA